MDLRFTSRLGQYLLESPKPHRRRGKNGGSVEKMLKLFASLNDSITQQAHGRKEGQEVLKRKLIGVATDSREMGRLLNVY